MSNPTLVDEAKRIADLFNNPKQWKIDTISPLFQQYPDATPADILGHFTKKSAVGFIYAAYYHVKSGIKANLLSPAFIAEHFSEIKVQSNETAMIAELLRVKSHATTSAPSLLKQYKAINTALNNLASAESEDSEKEALLLMAIREKLSILAPSIKVDTLV